MNLIEFKSKTLELRQELISSKIKQDVKDNMEFYFTDIISDIDFYLEQEKAA